jgi:hypothetical protein
MKECFVIMPIGSGDDYRTHKRRFEHIIKRAVQEYRVTDAPVFSCVRADFVSSTGSITRDVINRLYRAEVVIADLTELNPNVFYELGVRHALRDDTILVALVGTKVPFDLGDLRIVFYEDTVGAEFEAIPRIQQALAGLSDRNGRSDSPVLEAIPRLLERRDCTEADAKATRLEQDAAVLRAKLEVSEQANLNTQAILSELRKAIEKLGSRLNEAERNDVQTRVESAASAVSETRIPWIRGLREVDPEAVFVLMPFSPEFASVYELIALVAEKHGLRATRADAIARPGVIVDQIFEMISSAGLIVADVSARNPNVLYELGLAHSLRKEAILLCQDADSVPFDLRHHRYVQYSTTDEGFRALRKALSTIFREHSKTIHEQGANQSALRGAVIRTLREAFAANRHGEVNSIEPPLYERPPSHLTYAQTWGWIERSSTIIKLTENGLREVFGAAPSKD